MTLASLFIEIPSPVDPDFPKREDRILDDSGTGRDPARVVLDCLHLTADIARADDAVPR